MVAQHLAVLTGACHRAVDLTLGWLQIRRIYMTFGQCHLVEEVILSRPVDLSCYRHFVLSVEFLA